MTKHTERSVRWAAGTRQMIRGFPERVRSRFGRALYKAQVGKRHEFASPMKGRLRGVVELAVTASGNAYRLYYTLKCSGWVSVLYAHMKKSRQGSRIPRHEVDLIAERLDHAVADCPEDEEGP